MQPLAAVWSPRQRHTHGQHRAVAPYRLHRQLPTQCRHTLTHATQAIALGLYAATTIVADLHRQHSSFLHELDLRLGRLRMAHDVGGRFAQHQRQAAFDVHRHRRWRCVLQVHLLALQQQPCRGQFTGQVTGADTGDRAAHLGQRFAGDILGLADLLPRTGIASVVQLACQFQLQGDQRQGVAQQVVQVAADALTLGGGRQPPHLLLR